jgi:predicted neuraminidase
MRARRRGRAPIIIALGILGLTAAVRSAETGRHPAIVSLGFIYETAPYPSCHASTIVETAPGRLAAAWFGGTREGDPDVGIWLARHEGGRWLEPRQVAEGVQADGARLPTWNPVLFQPQGGPLWLFYKVGPDPRSWWGMAMTSLDEGRSWTRPERLPAGILGPIKNKPVVLRDGTWLSPSSVEVARGDWRMQFELSRDAGRSWELVGPVEAGPGFDAIQPSVLFHSDGSLQAVGRTRQGVVAMTWSKDGGRSWSPLAATDLPNPNSGTDALTLADGRQLIVYNHSGHQPATPGKGLRYPLDVAISDDGARWRRVLSLESEPCDAGYAYPAVIQAHDGLIHITYTWDRKRVRHAVLDPGKL